MTTDDLIESGESIGSGSPAEGDASTAASAGSSAASARPARRSFAEQQKLDEAYRKLTEESITFNGFLGFKVEHLSPADVRIGFDMRPELVGHFLHGRLHGGVISSVLDACGGLAVMCSVAEYHAHENTREILSRFAHVGTIDLRVDYLRQGLGRRFIASAITVRLGRRIAAASMRLVNDKDTLIATGNATYIVS